MTTYTNKLSITTSEGVKLQIWKNASDGDLNRLSIHRFSPNGKRKYKVGQINRSGVVNIKPEFMELIECYSEQIKAFVKAEFGDTKDLTILFDKSWNIATK